MKSLSARRSLKSNKRKRHWKEPNKPVRTTREKWFSWRSNWNKSKTRRLKISRLRLRRRKLRLTYWKKWWRQVTYKRKPRKSTSRDWRRSFSVWIGSQVLAPALASSSMVVSSNSRHRAGINRRVSTLSVKGTKCLSRRGSTVSCHRLKWQKQGSRNGRKR